MSILLRTLTLLLLAAPAAAQSRYVERLTPAAPIGFGTALELEGGDLFVGRTGALLGFPLNPSHPGAIHVFQRAGDGWRETTTIASDDLTLGDRFGSALSASGNVLMVGAPRHGDNGAVYVFEKKGSTWTRAARIDAPAGGKGDEFGLAVALEGSLLVVSAPSVDSARGVVYAFRPDRNGKWSEPVVIGRGAAVNDRFGRAIALAGNRVLVGAPGPVTSAPPAGKGGPDALVPKPGSAVLLRAEGGRWVEETRLTAGADTTAGFGFAVHLTSDEALVGMPGGAGAVYAFRAAAGRWAPAGKLVPAAPEPGTLFGFTLTRTDGSIFVGAQQANENAGRVHVFRAGSGGWRESQVLSTMPPRSETCPATGAATWSSACWAEATTPTGAPFSTSGITPAMPAASGAAAPASCCRRSTSAARARPPSPISTAMATSISCSATRSSPRSAARDGCTGTRTPAPAPNRRSGSAAACRCVDSITMHPPRVTWTATGALIS